MKGDRKGIEILSWIGGKEATGEYRKKFLLRPEGADFCFLFWRD